MMHSKPAYLRLLSRYNENKCRQDFLTALEREILAVLETAMLEGEGYLLSEDLPHVAKHIKLSTLRVLREHLDELLALHIDKPALHRGSYEVPRSTR